MEFNDETLNFLMKSSAMSLTDEERTCLKEDLKKIFTHIESLDQVPTDHVAPCAHPLTLCNVVRDDVAASSLDRQKFLENCPSQIAGMVRVPTVINKE